MLYRFILLCSYYIFRNNNTPLELQSFQSSIFAANKGNAGNLSEKSELKFFPEDNGFEKSLLINVSNKNSKVFESSVGKLDWIFSSNKNSKVFQSLVDKLDGIPIWPPIKKIKLLDVIVIHKNGKVDTLQNDVSALKDLHGLDGGDKQKLQDLMTNIMIKSVPDYKLDSSNGSNNSANLAMIQAFGVGGSFTYDKDSSVTIRKCQTTKIGTENGNGAVEVLEQVLDKKAKIDEVYGRHGKKVFVVTEVTTAEGYTVSSSSDTSVSTDIKVSGQGGDTVTIAIKALCFKVSPKGVLEEPALYSHAKKS